MYAYDGDGPVPRLTTDPAIQKVGHFPIRMPKLDGIKPGDKVNLTIKMYFGLTEIKIESTIQDKSFVFTSAFDAFDASDPQAATPVINQPIGMLPISNLSSPVPSTAYPVNGYSSYPNVMPQPNMYNNSSSSIGYSTSISNQDFYAQPQQSHRQPYTPQQQQRQPYLSQGYRDNTNNNNSGYPPVYNNSNSYR